MRVRSLGREDPLEKETATHSSILAWEVPWAEEPTVQGVTEGQTRLSKLSLHQHLSTHTTWKLCTCSEENGVSDGWGECCFIQDGQGNVVISEQRPKGSEERSVTEIWGERALQEEEAACAKVLGWMHPWHVQ